MTREEARKAAGDVRERFLARVNGDGGPGSGNWGHRGRPGQHGGSMPGGGVQNRRYRKQGDPDRGFTSAAKEEAERVRSFREAAKTHRAGRNELDRYPKGSVITVTSSEVPGMEGTWVKTDGSDRIRRTSDGEKGNTWSLEGSEVQVAVPQKSLKKMPVKPGLQLTEKERERWKHPKGPRGAEPAKTVEEMVGADAVKEYDSGSHPNTYPPDDPRWGTEPGEYTVYRSGDLDRDIIFTANKAKGAELYADAFPQTDRQGEEKRDSMRTGVYTYTVKVTNPYVSKNMPAAYRELFGKPVKLEPTPGQARKGITPAVLQARADARIAKELKKRGYDAWTMTEPAPPAEKELNVFGAAKESLTETARHVPEYIKKSWRAEVQLQDMHAFLLRGGKPTGLTVEDWFASDLYKTGRVQNRW